MLKIGKQKKNRKRILREEKLKKEKKEKTSRSTKDKWGILRIVERSNGKE